MLLGGVNWALDVFRFMNQMRQINYEQCQVTNNITAHKRVLSCLIIRISFKVACTTPLDLAKNLPFVNMLSFIKYQRIKAR